MFENKKIKELEDKITKLEDRQFEYFHHIDEVLRSITEQSKKKFMYDIRQEEIELIEDGKKYRAIRKII